MLKNKSSFINDKVVNSKYIVKNLMFHGFPSNQVTLL